MKRIIDRRKKEKFMVDDKYLNGQARVCGWQASLVYFCLCRHASLEQECFPSIKMLSEKLNISRDSVIRGIHSLEKHNVIQISKTRKKDGKWLNNKYVLLDKKVWTTSQVAHSDMVSQVAHSVKPSRSQRKAKSLTATLRKHIEGNTYKETHGVPAKARTPQAAFVDNWESLYKSETGKPFKADRKDYILSARLLKDFGEAEVLSRARILFSACKNCSLWFTKDGMANFTLGKLSSQWNSLIEKKTSYDQAMELANELKMKRETQNARP